MIEVTLRLALLEIGDYIDRLSGDGELSDQDLTEILAALDSIRAAIEYEQSCREEACSAAAGSNVRTEI